MEQLVARWAHNPKVAGSSPVPATISLENIDFQGFFIFANTPLPTLLTILPIIFDFDLYKMNGDNKYYPLKIERLIRHIYYRS